MITSQKGIDLIKKFEGLRLKAYQDAVGVWTIGYGTIMYPDGTRVKKGDVITEDRAEALLIMDVARRSAAIGNIKVSQNQFDAIVSFCYNLGLGAWNKSTLRKKIIQDRNDPTIRDEFMKWVNAGGKRLPGLVRRRKQEADLYFS